MIKFNFNALSRQAKIGYNALYNVIYPYAHDDGKQYSFIVPLCFNSDNKVSLTEKNFIFFDSVLSELKIYGWYSIVENKGHAFDDVKGNFYTVSITVSSTKIEPPENLVIKTFDFSNVDFSKLLKRDWKAEKAKTAKNKKTEEEKATEVETLKKEIAKKDEQLNQKAIDEFNDDALITIASSVEFLVKKHCPVLPENFDFSSFEVDLFKVINAKWDLKVLDK